MDWKECPYCGNRLMRIAEFCNRCMNLWKDMDRIYPDYRKKSPPSSASTVKQGPPPEAK